MMAQAAGLAGSSHLVQFHDDDHVLVRSVASYLSEAVARGETALVFATPDHSTAFARAVGSDALTTFDAAETLARFMIDGRPDPVAFDAVVGDRVRRIAREGGRVCAYGEMVALLWEAGNVTGALALEELWNSLLGTVAFRLFCAYPTSAIRDDQAGALMDVCGLHSEIVGGYVPRMDVTEIRQEFPFEKGSPAAARRFVAQTLRWWRCDHLIEDASVVTTELATNAIIHARCGFAVSIASRSGAVRIGIEDEGTSLPTRTTPATTEIGGRGLHLVEEVSAGWGTEPTRRGKLVWAEFKDRTEGSPATAEQGGQGGKR